MRSSPLESCDLLYIILLRYAFNVFVSSKTSLSFQLVLEKGIYIFIERFGKTTPDEDFEVRTQHVRPLKEHCGELLGLGCYVSSRLVGIDDSKTVLVEMQHFQVFKLANRFLAQFVNISIVTTHVTQTYELSKDIFLSVVRIGQETPPYFRDAQSKLLQSTKLIANRIQ